MPVVTGAAYRQALARELDPRVATTSTIVSTVTHPDSKRMAAIPGLQMQGVSVDTDTPYVGAWFKVNSGANNGFTARIVRHHTLYATVTLDQQMGADLVNGDTVEIGPYFPLAGGSGQVSYLDLLNMALRDLWVEDEHSVTLTAGTRSYGLSALSYWLTDRARLLRVLDPPIYSGYPPRDADWRGPELRWNDGTPTLWLHAAPESTGESLTLTLTRPANTLISGAESSVGFTSDTQTATAEVSDVVTVALMYAYRELAARGEPPRSASQGAKSWEQLADEQETRVRSLVHYMGRSAAPMAAPAGRAA